MYVFAYYLLCKQTFYKDLSLEVILSCHRTTWNITGFKLYWESKVHRVVSTKVHTRLVTMEVLCQDTCRVKKKNKQKQTKARTLKIRGIYHFSLLWSCF